MVIQCCKCKKIKTRDGWVRTDQVVEGSHTYCPSCLVTAKAEIKEFQNQQGKELRGTGNKMTRLAV